MATIDHRLPMTAQRMRAEVHCIAERGAESRILPPAQSRTEPRAGDFIANAHLVREQLNRLLAHPLFKKSKRYPVLLAYTVEQTLLGNEDYLKERTIGVEAFGRKPDYDVSLDPVVRTTAAEVRKRLSQYYFNPQHARELIIELPVGAYVPAFREPAPMPTSLAAGPVLAAKMMPSPREPLTLPVVDARSTPSVPRFALDWRIAIAIALLFAAFIGFDVGRAKPTAPPSDLDRFWNPITASSSTVTYFVAEPGRNDKQADASADRMNVSDVTTVARSLLPVLRQNAAFRVVAASLSTFPQVREGPAVFIGAFDNPWTMRITQDLPIGIECGNPGCRIVSRKSSPKASWSDREAQADSKIPEHCALVARIHDKVTGQTVIILAGIPGEGTEAASEVVTSPTFLKAVLEKAPKDWDQLNLEAVITTEMIENQARPLGVVAVETW